MQPEEFRAAKAQAITDCILNSAQISMRLSSEIVKLSRKLPRIKSKRISNADRIKWRQKIACMHAQLCIHMLISSSQLGIILSQPIPKFKPGANNEQQAEVYSADNTISEGKQEYIFNPFASNTNAIYPIPPGQRDNI